ncbi:hypothetical protein EV174_003809 [Coemansia sp. RSA 2320]|nr:hypothetical protein EV174_003809 [Coemansia sp. RSA 2320]
MESASLKLAQGFAKDAQKASKGGWFSKPDWAIAAQYLDKAATAYKSARHYDEAVNCYTQASEAYIQMNVIHLAASCMENAAKLSEAHLKDHAKAITNYMRASDLYRSYGSAADKAAVMMEKAAKVCEDIDTDRAIQLYDNALLAAVCEQVNNRLELNRSYLSVIAMLLAFGDSVEAGKRLDEFGQDVAFIRTKEAEAAERLVQAYNDGDQDEYASIAGSLPVTSLDAVISRLTAKTRIPGARRPEPKATNSSAMQTGLTSSEKQAAFGGEHSGGSDRAAAAAPPFDDGDDDDDLL